MNAERWQKIENVLQAALDHAPHERATFLDDACLGDPKLKAEATSLLDAYDEAGDFIEQPALMQNARVFVGDDLDSKLGRSIGPYKLFERLGVGGMGEV